MVEQAAAVHLDLQPLFGQAEERVVVALKGGDALDVGDDHTLTGVEQLVHGVQQILLRALEGGLDQVAVRGGQRQDGAGLQPLHEPLVKGDLHARIDTQGNGFGIEAGLHGRDPHRDGLGLRGPGRARNEMGRGHHCGKAGRRPQSRHGHALLQVAGAVVDAGQDVAVDVDQAGQDHAVASASARAVLPTSLVSRAVASSAARVTA